MSTTQLDLDFSNEPNEAKFNKFHRDNPKVYELFKKFTFEFIEAGAKNTGSKAVIERIRWFTTVETTGKRYKINNNYTCMYSRLFMRDFPQYTGLFRTRELKS